MTTATNASYLRTLNPEQREAALHTDGPLLVLAGAGSGKTKTLVHRIVHLIRGRDVDPSRIVVVTFTNKAADEMRERARAYAGKEVRRAVISTFHSLGVRILRRHADRLDLPRNFAIYATADRLAALRTACREISIDNNRFDLKRILWQISDWKVRRVSPEEAGREVRETAATGTRADDYAVLAADAYARYEDVLRAAGAVDFDDLLLRPVRLLEEDDEVRQSLWREWHYFMVDEYQDTNSVQLDLVRLLSGPRRNLCVVGDDDQSIYAFRGADVSNILGFEEHFSGARVIKLEQNYRSTRMILDAANAIIAENDHRHPKRLRTDNPDGAPVDFYEHEDETAEAEAIAKEISLRNFRYKRDWSDFAILYRTNTQARPLEEALREQNVPYRVIGGTSFFERKEVADGLAYLRAIAAPGDEIALRRIINYPSRGIGRTTVMKIVERARAEGIPFVDAAAAADPEHVGAPQARSIGELLALLDEEQDARAEAEARAERPPPATGYPPIAAWAEAFFDRVGLEQAIRSDRRNAHSADRRVDNLRDLVGAIARYERRTWAQRAGLDDEAVQVGDWTPPTLTEAVARLALLTSEENESEGDEAPDKVTLMTLHAAKGLEFADVFMVGLEEEILPHARALDAAKEAPELDPLAEERRLMYVGITRARKRLTLSLCRGRTRRGETIPRLPSRYLEAIPERLLNVKTADRMLSPEESAELRENFFDSMREMLIDDDEEE